MAVFLRRTLFVLALLAAALSAGFFYTYSISVMPGLTATEPASSIRVMQSINAGVRTPLFAFAFFGALVLPLLAAFAARSAGHRGAARLAFAAAIIHAAAVVVVTLQINVPLNESLVLVIPTPGAEAAKVWSDYDGPWTRWNHVRALGGVVSFLCLLAAFAADLTAVGRRPGLR